MLADATNVDSARKRHVDGAARAGIELPPVAGPVVEVQDLRKRLGGREILRGVDLSLIRGDIVAIIGDNGSGKTTLLRQVAGLSRPSAGAVRVLGADPHDIASVRRSIGSVLHEPGLYPELTARAHLAWWSQLQRAQTNVASLLDQAGLLSASDVPAGRLSRGQRQRLALAMAFAASPPLLVLDEPWTGLDAAGSAWLDAELKARSAEAAILLTTHQPTDAQRLATRVLRLTRGRLEDA